MAPGPPSTSRLKSESLLGTGLTSEVFSWGEERVLKLFLPGKPLAIIRREFTVSQLIHQTGVPSPAVFEMLQVGDRYGIVFERVRGVSLLQQVSAQPWKLFSAARLLAELHAWIHEQVVPGDLPTQPEQIQEWIGGGRTLDDETWRELPFYLKVRNCPRTHPYTFICL